MKIMGFKVEKYELVAVGVVAFLATLVNTVCYLYGPNSNKAHTLLLNGVGWLAVGIYIFYRARKKG